VREYFSQAILAMGEKSLDALRPIANKVPIVLIGGMAVSRYSPEAAKSHDPDILVEANGLAQIKNQFPAMQNARLSKFEVKIEGGADIDVYLIYTARIEGIDLQAAFKRSVLTADGFRVVSYEDLLRLKTAVFQARRDTPKGRKDAGDLVALLRDRPESCGVPPEIREDLRALLDDGSYLATVKHIEHGDIRSAKKHSREVLDKDTAYQEPPEDPDLEWV
jgi:hypothetical protein